MSSRPNPSRIAGRGLLAVALGIALVVPAPAVASSDDLWAECVANGTVSTNHTQKEFQDAQTDPPADGAEYTDCLSLIAAAQKRAAVGGGTGGTGGAGGTGAAGTAGGGTGTGAAPQSVAPEALQQALAAKGIDPAAPAGTVTEAPAPSMIGGEKIDLESDRLPSLANTLSLPLPLAASAVVVLFSAALPVVRFAVGRFGAPPTGTSPTL